MPCQPWSAFGLTEEAAATWRTRAPYLPLGRLDRADLSRHLEGWALECGHSPVAESDALGRGFARVFSGPLDEVGRPPRWMQNVLTGGTVDSSRHWSHCSDAGAEDIKGVWELSRFSWVFPLVRAWVLDGDARHVERFWITVEDWMEHNPPNRGPQWMCGQEAAFRLIALSFGLQAFRHHPVTTAARLVLASRLAEATAQRIEGHIHYALSQQNNHGIAEAIGLMTAGVFWPTLPRAPDWRRRGRSALWQQVDTLIGPDGGFSQHSTNYHRLLLQLLVWAELVCRAAGSTLPAPVRRKAVLATDFLATLMEADGTVPRYGADDGADLFPLSGCFFEDFRPAVGTALTLFKGERLPAGPWDEAALLLLGPLAASVVDVLPPQVDHPASGVTVLRNLRGLAFFRAPTEFHTRPSQADQLHVSLRWDGEWIAEDVGSYSYNTPLAGGDFGGAIHHNVVTVNGRDPMRRFRRFLWLPWTACHRTAGPACTAWHDGYPGVRTARTVLRLRQGFVIIDRLSGPVAARYELRWHGRTRAGLEQLTVACSAPSTEEYVTALPDGGEGWHSSHYGSREPSWCRRITATGNDVTFVTALGCSLRLEDHSFFADGEEYPLE